LQSCDRRMLRACAAAKIWTLLLSLLRPPLAAGYKIAHPMPCMAALSA
jgi:hypothetical protein